MSINFKDVINRINKMNNIIPESLKPEESFDPDEYNDWASRIGIGEQYEGKVSLDGLDDLPEPNRGVLPQQHDHTTSYRFNLGSDQPPIQGSSTYTVDHHRHAHSQAHSHAYSDNFYDFNGDMPYMKPERVEHEDKITHYQELVMDEQSGSTRIESFFMIGRDKFRSYNQALEYLNGAHDNGMGIDQADRLFHTIKGRVLELAYASQQASRGRTEHTINDYLNYIRSDGIIDRFALNVNPSTFDYSLSLSKDGHTIRFDLSYGMMDGVY